MRLAIEMFAMTIVIAISVLLFSSMISSSNQVDAARDYYNTVINRIEDSYCNKEVINECIVEAENKGYKLEVCDVTMYEDNQSRLVTLTYQVNFPIMSLFKKNHKKQAVIEGYAG